MNSLISKCVLLSHHGLLAPISVVLENLCLLRLEVFEHLEDTDSRMSVSPIESPLARE